MLDASRRALLGSQQPRRVPPLAVALCSNHGRVILRKQVDASPAVTASATRRDHDRVLVLTGQQRQTPLMLTPWEAAVKHIFHCAHVECVCVSVAPEALREKVSLGRNSFSLKEERDACTLHVHVPKSPLLRRPFSCHLLALASLYFSQPIYLDPTSLRAPPGPATAFVHPRVHPTLFRYKLLVQRYSVDRLRALTH